MTSRGRRRLVRSIPNLTFVTCAHWMLDRVRVVYPAIATTSITNGVDQGFAAAADAALARANGRIADLPEKPHVLVAGTDLGDTSKHDHQLLARLAEKPIRITTVGKRSPIGGTNVTNLGGLTGRDRMADMYAAADLMVFTSRLDYFPLTIAECLYTGTPVVAIKSPAADEVLGHVGAATVGTAGDIVKAVSRRSWPELYPSLDRSALAARARNIFGPETFTQAYLRLYSTLLGASNAK
jgi:putative colanic acid biosynthesis glycosyltransferase